MIEDDHRSVLTRVAETNKTQSIAMMNLNKLIAIYKRKKRKQPRTTSFLSLAQEDSDIEREFMRQAQEEIIRKPQEKIQFERGIIKQAMFKNRTPLLNYILIIITIFMQLHCDISTGQQQQQQTTNASVANFNELTNQLEPLVAPDQAPANAPIFLQEPNDSEALIGQTVHFTCLVNSRQLLQERATLKWDQFTDPNDHHLLLLNNQTLGLRYSVPSFQLPASSGSYDLDSDSLSMANNGSGFAVTNYSLEIKNINLADDRNYGCGFQYQTGKILNSKPAKLTVLKPPSQLKLKVFKLDNNGEYFEEMSEQSSSDTFSATNGQSGDHEQAGSEASGSQLSGNTIQVKQNDQLKLECESDLAKPHAELVWLDERQNQVFNKGNNNNNSSDLYVEDLIEPDSNQPKLFKSKSILHWKNVQPAKLSPHNHHSNPNELIKFTCLIRHKTFQPPLAESMNNLASAKQVRQLKAGLSVKFDVHYAPEVELLKSSMMPAENEQFKLTCKANARPSNNLNFKWFLDNQLIEGADGFELIIEKLSRQLHMRQVACQVSNEIGFTTKELKLSVLYSPNYITPLLPLSLQPASPADELQFPPLRQLQQLSGQRAGHPKRISATSLFEQPDLFHLKRPSARQFQLAKELAIGFDLGQDLELRCDFDSNPRLSNVSWFKISANEYETMQEVSSNEADELIAFGKARAVFKHVRILENSQDHLERSHKSVLSKRHISMAGEPRNTNDFDEPEPDSLELDYKQMSMDILRDLGDLFRLQQQRRANSSSPEPEMVEQLLGSSLRQTNQLIQEPLSWQLRTVTFRNGSPASGFSPAHSDGGAAGEALFEPELEAQVLSLSQRQPNATGPNNKLSKRETQVSSSSISFRLAQDDLSGRYVCKTEQSQHLNLKHEDLAHSVYLIQRKSPRIISQKRQFVQFSWDQRQVQVDCLVQINTVLETKISWFKNGRLISMSSEQYLQAANKNYSIEYQRSPDLLFMRSILRINNADQSDFGTYNCTAENAYLPMDHLEINVQLAESTGFVFIVGSTIAIGSVILLLSILGLMLAFSSLGYSQAHKKKSSKFGEIPITATGSAKLNQTGQLSQQTAITKPGCDVAESQAECQNCSDQESQSDEGIVCDTQQANSQQQLNGGSSNRNVSSKFSAIHQSLENRLQFNQFTTAPTGTTSTTNRPSEQSNLDHSDGSGSSVVIKSQAISEISDRNKLSSSSSLINRLMLKLMLSKSRDRSSAPSSRSVKSRPTISMPIQSQHSGSSLVNGSRKSSLSTSFSVLNGNQVHQQSSADGFGLSNSKRAAKNLLSSSTNLIQDSAASGSSDNCARTSSTSATSGSSRSSSSSGGVHHANQHQQLNGYQLSTPMAYQTSVPLPVPVSSRQQSPRLLMINEQQYGAAQASVVHYQDADPYTMSAIYQPQPNQFDQSGNLAVWNPSLLCQDSSGSQHYQLPMAVDSQQSAYNQVSNYGTLAVSMPQQVGDGGDAYFESNYNALLSSAYRNLNCGQPGHQNISNSSSPNSLTTQNTSSNQANHPIVYNTAYLDSQPQFEQPNQQLMYDNQSATVVATLADSSVVTKTVNGLLASDNGIATHV